MKITLKTLPKATAQQVFNQVYRHLMRQKKKSKNGNTCAYRSKDGLKCAAGCLIGATEYKENMEGTSWSWLPKIPQAHLDLINELQVIHDGCHPRSWRKQLAALAYRNGFTIPKV